MSYQPIAVIRAEADVSKVPLGYIQEVVDNIPRGHRAIWKGCWIPPAPPQSFCVGVHKRVEFCVDVHKRVEFTLYPRQFIVSKGVSTTYWQIGKLIIIPTNPEFTSH